MALWLKEAVLDRCSGSHGPLSHFLTWDGAVLSIEVKVREKYMSWWRSWIVSTKVYITVEEICATSPPKYTEIVLNMKADTQTWMIIKKKDWFSPFWATHCQFWTARQWKSYKCINESISQCQILTTNLSDDEPICLFTQNSVFFIVTIFACLLFGCLFFYTLILWDRWVVLCFCFFYPFLMCVYCHLDWFLFYSFLLRFESLIRFLSFFPTHSIFLSYLLLIFFFPVHINKCILYRHSTTSKTFLSFNVFDLSLVTDINPAQNPTSLASLFCIFKGKIQHPLKAENSLCIFDRNVYFGCWMS